MAISRRPSAKLVAKATPQRPSYGLGLGAMACASGHASKANGHKLGAMAQDIRYPRVCVGKPVGRELRLNPRFATISLYVRK